MQKNDTSLRGVPNLASGFTGPALEVKPTSTFSAHRGIGFGSHLQQPICCHCRDCCCAVAVAIAAITAITAAAAVAAIATAFAAAAVTAAPVTEPPLLLSQLLLSQLCCRSCAVAIAAVMSRLLSPLPLSRLWPLVAAAAISKI